MAVLKGIVFRSVSDCVDTRFSVRRCSAVLGGMQGMMNDNKQANARDKLSYIYLCCPKGKPNNCSEATVYRIWSRLYVFKRK